MKNLILIPSPFLLSVCLIYAQQAKDKEGNTTLHNALQMILRFKPVLPMLKEKI
jgi:hypothetical protein